MEVTKKVIVIGGAGFIGSHVVAELHSNRIQVLVYDSLVTGSRNAIPTDVPLIVGDIRDYELLTEAIRGSTHVINLAAVVSVSQSIREPFHTHDVNVTGFMRVLEAARSAGTERIVFASSAAVYGDEPAIPKSEEMELFPKSPYALSKIQNEQDALLYSELYGISCIGLRFFNVYGPGQSGSHPYASVVPRFIEAVKSGIPLEIFGDGTQTRDFVHVRDIARAICMALDVEQIYTVFNIASGIEVSLLDLHEVLEKTTGIRISKNHHAVREGDIHRSVASIKKAEKELSFTASISFDEGIRELI